MKTQIDYNFEVHDLYLFVTRYKMLNAKIQLSNLESVEMPHDHVLRMHPIELKKSLSYRPK